MGREKEKEEDCWQIVKKSKRERKSDDEKTKKGREKKRQGHEQKNTKVLEKCI